MSNYKSKEIFFNRYYIFFFSNISFFLYLFLFRIFIHIKYSSFKYTNMSLISINNRKKEIIVNSRVYIERVSNTIQLTNFIVVRFRKEENEKFKVISLYYLFFSSRNLTVYYCNLLIKPRKVNTIYYLL